MWSLDFLMFESKSAAPPERSMRHCRAAAMVGLKEIAVVA
jgi:hypothetical protein